MSFVRRLQRDATGDPTRHIQREEFPENSRAGARTPCTTAWGLPKGTAVRDRVRVHPTPLPTATTVQVPSPRSLYNL